MLEIDFFDKKTLNLQCYMKKITLSTDKHRNKNIVTIKFGYNDEIKNYLKRLDIVIWSNTIRSFYIDLSLENIRIVFNHLKIKNWSVDYSPLKDSITTNSPWAITTSFCLSLCFNIKYLFD